MNMKKKVYPINLFIILSLQFFQIIAYSQTTDIAQNKKTEQKNNIISIEIPVPQKQYSDYISKYGGFAIYYGRMVYANRLEFMTGFQYWYIDYFTSKNYNIPVGFSFYPIGTRYLLDIYAGVLTSYSKYGNKKNDMYVETFKSNYGCVTQFGLGFTARPLWNNITLNIRENIYTRFNGTITARLSIAIGYQF